MTLYIYIYDYIYIYKTKINEERVDKFERQKGEINGRIQGFRGKKKGNSVIIYNLKNKINNNKLNGKFHLCFLL